MFSPIFNRKASYALILSIFLTLTGLAQIPTMDRDFPSTNGQVYAFEKDEENGITYVAGNFTQLQFSLPFHASFDSLANSLKMERPNGAVYDMLEDGNGGWYVAGSFREIGGQQIFGLARYKSDGTLDPTFNANINQYATVYCMHIANGKMYIGGNFYTVGGQSRSRFAVIDPADGSVQSDVIFINGDVRAIATSGDTVFIGGIFSGSGNLASADFSRLNKTSGALQSGLPQVDGYLHSALPDGNGGWYIGGQFEFVDGVPRKNLARINPDGSIHPWNPSRVVQCAN